MITLKELNPRKYPLTPEIESNLKHLLECINVIRMAWNKPMIVTSALRSQEQQKALIECGKSNAPKSKHLLGQALDISDPNGMLYYWLKDHPEILEKAELWCEERMGNWVHFQSVPPRSKKRWFLP